MKTTRIILAALLLTACSVSAQSSATPTAEKKYKPEELKSVPNVSYTDKDRKTEFPKHEGKVVRLRVTMRDTKTKPNSNGVEVTICQAQPRADGSGSAGLIKLIVPAEGQAWATAVPIEWKRGRGDDFVYARITSAKDGYETAEALGTKIVNGLKGPELVW